MSAAKPVMFIVEAVEQLTSALKAETHEKAVGRVEDAQESLQQFLEFAGDSGDFPIGKKGP